MHSCRLDFSTPIPIASCGAYLIRYYLITKNTPSYILMSSYSSIFEFLSNMCLCLAHGAVRALDIQRKGMKKDEG